MPLWARAHESRAQYVQQDNSGAVRNRAITGEYAPHADYWSLSFALKHLGDRWSLLIVRELLTGEQGFNDLSRALPDLSRTLLSQRLKRLVDMGLLLRESSADPRGTRLYRLTGSGYALSHTLESLGIWVQHWGHPVEHDLQVGVATLLGQMRRALVAQSLPQDSMLIAFVFETQTSRQLRGYLQYERETARSELGRPNASPDLEVHVSPRVLYELWWGIRRCAEARRRGDIGFVGPSSWGEHFSGWFLPRPFSEQNGRS
ncbi:winged helix-turn-helix transcriptional regulator [Leucobacter ruminantium]